MEPYLIIAVVLAGIAIVVVTALRAAHRARKRSDEMRAWANGRNLDFFPEKHRTFEQEYPDFDCLSEGSNRYAFNIIAGHLNGWEVRLFDYHFETYSYDSKGSRQTHTHYFSAVIVESRFRLVPLKIQPEGLVHRISAFFGADDIHFESAEFSRRYHVTSPDRRWAYDVIHAEVIELLLRLGGISIQADHHAMLCFSPRQRYDLDEFQGAFAVVTKVLGNIPEYARERATAYWHTR